MNEECKRKNRESRIRKHDYKEEWRKGTNEKEGRTENKFWCIKNREWRIKHRERGKNENEE